MVLSRGFRHYIADGCSFDMSGRGIELGTFSLQKKSFCNRFSESVSTAHLVTYSIHPPLKLKQKKERQRALFHFFYRYKWWCST
jgi:hypothetical protein